MSSASSSLPSTSSTPPTSVPITPGEPVQIVLKEHAFYCFEVLAAHLENRHPSPPPFKTEGSYKRNKPALRGCIGTFTPLPLAKGLKQYALISALEDHRFPPIKHSELHHLHCHISLLTPFVPISDPLDWTVGTHGIHITFPNPRHPSSSLSATYLPEVTSEQGWTKEEAVLSAIQKAGYRGTVRVGDEVWRSLKVKVYTSQKVGASWDEFVQWKGTSQGVDGTDADSVSQE